MGIYSDGLSYASTGAPIFTDTLDSIREDSSVEVYENYDLMEEGYVAIGVMNENYNRLMSTIGIQELVALESTGEELVYTEGVLGSLVNGIKNFLKKIWERIKSLFKHFMMIIDGYMKNDKDFCNKYRKQIYAYHDLSDFTFKGYKWTINQTEITNAMDKCKFAAMKDSKHFGVDMKAWSKDIGGEEEGKDAYKTVIEKFDDNFEKYRGDILTNFTKIKVSAGSAHTMEEFRKELKGAFRNGEEAKEELDDKDIDVGDMFTELFTSKQTKKTAQDVFKTAKKSVEEEIKDFDRADKEHVNNAPWKDDTKTEPTSTTNDVASIKAIMPMSAKSSAQAAADWLVGHCNSSGDESTVKGIVYDGSTTNVKTSLATADDVIDAAKAVVFKGVKGGKLQGENASKRLNIMVRAARDCKECLLAINTAVLDALKERSRQYKACLTKIVYHKGKSESAYTESVYDREPSAYGTDFISSIEFK